MIDTWQFWAASVVGILVTKLTWDQRQEKVRAEKYVDKVIELSERVTRVESEIVTEREVREILHELIEPVASGLVKIESKQDSIASDLTDIKIALGKLT